MEPPLKPILKKPPGYKEPTTPSPSAQPKPLHPPPYRKSVLPPSFHRLKKKPISRICCCFVFALLLLLIACLAVSGGAFYLWFALKPPSFRLRSVSFSRFAVAAEADGTCDLDSRANVWVEVKNPNAKLRMYYAGSKVALSAAEGDTDLGWTSSTEFAQEKRNVTVLKFVMRGKQVVDLGTGKRLNSTVNRGAVKLKVEVKTRLGIGVGVGVGVGKSKIWKVGMLPVQVECGGVTLNKMRAGGGGPSNCKISWFKW